MNLKAVAAVCTGLLFAGLAGCVSSRSAVATSPKPPEELSDRAFLREVVRYLYRWHMDEEDIDRASAREPFHFWIRTLSPEMDPEDRSRFAEIVLPGLGIYVTLKDSDYRIEELDVRVVSDGFKIVNVARHAVPARKPRGYEEVVIDYAEMRDDLFRTRKDAQFPDEMLQRRMRESVREELQEDVRDHDEAVPEGQQVVHIAPLSPVANELWVFWETGRLLIRFSSDIDIESPVLWEHEDLAMDFYDVDEQVVVSLDEAAGSNAYLTRDQVGRALFNCVILGQRIVLDPL